MRRRALLGAVGAAGLAGCVGSLDGFLGDDEPDCPDAYDHIDFDPVEDHEDAILSGPECPRGSPQHPTYGDPLPDFSLPDPLRDETVERDDLVADGPLVLTFIFTNCPDRCPEIMGIFQIMQADAIEEGWDNDVTLAAMTWDPARDDAAALRNYGEQHGIDVDHDRFRYLRPETNEEALDVVDGTFGVPATHGTEDHDHDDEEGDGHAHYYMIFIVNGDGVVERSYPGPILFYRSPDDIVSDVRTVVTEHAET